MPPGPAIGSPRTPRPAIATITILFYSIPNLDRGQAELCDLGSGLLLLPQLALDVLQPLAAHVTAVLPLRWIMIEEKKFFFLQTNKRLDSIVQIQTDIYKIAIKTNRHPYLVPQSIDFLTVLDI